MARPSLGPGAASDLIFGIGSHLKFAEQTIGGTAITTAEGFSRYNVAVNSMTITPTSTLLTPGVIPTTVEQFQGVPGPLSIAGTFTLDALPKRMELIFRQLLNAPTTNVTDIVAAATGAGAGVGSGTEQTVISAAAVADAPVTSGFTDPTKGLPIQLTGELSDDPDIGGSTMSATNPLTVTITGTDYSNNTFSSVLTFTDSGSTATQTTNSYFKTVTSVSFTGAGSVTGGETLSLKGTSNRKGVQIESNPTYRLTPGLTIEAVNGSGIRRSVTNTIIDGYIGSFNWTASREENITYTFGLVGKTFNAGVNPAGNSYPLGLDSAGAKATTGAQARTASATGPYGTGDFLTLQDDQVPYAGYGVCFGATIGGSMVTFPQITGASLTLDNATNFTPRLYTIQPGLVYNRQRTISGEVTLEYHKSDAGAVNDYLSGTTWDNVFISLGNRGIGAVPDETVFVFPKTQLTEYPAIPIEDDDFVSQTLRFVALPTSGSNANAITVRCYYDDVDVSGLSLANLT